MPKVAVYRALETIARYTDKPFVTVGSSEKISFRFIDLFAGIGGLLTGLHGVEAVSIG